jgi:DNA-binding LacI/PurR family transcriptional regulator
MPISLAFDRYEPGRVEQLLTLWHASPPRAVLVRGASRQVAETVQKHSPAITRFIMIFGLLDGTSPHWHCVRPDELMSYRMAVKHLLDKGHRRIGMPMTVYSEMSEPDLEYHVRDKVRGMRQAFVDAGLPDGLLLHRKRVVPVDPSNIGLSDANIADTVKWLRSPDGPTGIVENTYRMPYVMVAARLAGLTIGKDLDVVGVGDPTPAYQGMFPVVSERFDVIAREVAAMVAVEDENFDQLGRQVVVPPILVPQWQPGMPPAGNPVA